MIARHLDLLIKYKKNLKSNKGMTEILPFQVKLYQKKYIIQLYFQLRAFLKIKSEFPDVTRKRKKVYLLLTKQAE